MLNSIKEHTLSEVGKEVIRFYELVGYDFKDKTVIGKRFFKWARNTIRDIPKFFGTKDTYICVHPLKIRRLKANVTRVFTCFVDFDFKDYDLALAHIDRIKALLDQYGFYYGIVHSGRGLHLYIPVGNVGGEEITQVNLHLNKVIFSEYFTSGVIDPKPIKNYATFLRLPETINSKNGKRTFIAFQNLEAAAEQSIDYFTHNHEIMLNSIAEHESKPQIVPPTYDQKIEIDYKHSFFKWEFFECIIAGGARYEVLREIVSILKMKEDRELNNTLFPNLAVYIKSRSSKETERERLTENAIKFIKSISDDPDDPANLKRWLESYDERENTDNPLVFNSVEMRNWAERHFSETIIYRNINDDCDRLYRHNAYFTFIEENLNGDSVDAMRANWRDFVSGLIETAGFHWGVLETGIGKTELFLEFSRSGKKVVFLVPYLMLKFDLEREVGKGAVFTLDTVRSGNRIHSRRHDLILQLADADIVVVDEAHCIDLHYSLKPEIMDEFNQQIRIVAREKPVFMLTGTPSINQILEIENPRSSKIVSYLRKDLKRISVKVIDKLGLEAVLQDHKKVLIFIDDKRQIKTLQNLMDLHLRPKHRVFPIHSEITTANKKKTEQEIRNCEQWIIIGTSAVVSGINIDGLETIVFGNQIINQQNLYQCMGRLRIVNRLDRVHPIYLLNLAAFKNLRPDWDMFEYVSPASIIKYLSKLYHITRIIPCDKKIRSISQLWNFEDWKELIRSVPNIKEYYGLERVREENLYWIPFKIIRELNDEGFFHDNPNWFNVPIKSILYMKNDEPSVHRARIEVRNIPMSLRNPFWHYFDPAELNNILNKFDGSSVKPKKRFPECVKSILATLYNDCME